MKTKKSIKEVILSVLFTLSIMAFCCESEDFMSQVIWLVCWGAVFAFSGWSLSKMMEDEDYEV